MTPTPDSSSTPPLSDTPPPTITQPVPRPTKPSDQFAEVKLVGSAVRDAHGCVLLTTEGGRFALVGDAADQALGPGKVSVVAMPKPTASSPCDVPVMAVQSVTAVS